MCSETHGFCVQWCELLQSVGVEVSPFLEPSAKALECGVFVCHFECLLNYHVPFPDHIIDQLMWHVLSGTPLFIFK